jgi:hypothetical protein
MSATIENVADAVTGEEEVVVDVEPGGRGGRDRRDNDSSGSVGTTMRPSDAEVTGR